MKILVNHIVFRRTYQGLFLLLMMVIPNFALSLITSYNSQIGLTFTNFESWGIIAINLIIFYLTYLWAKSEGLMTRFRLDLKDAKAIIWGFLTIFLMGVIGSNLMLLTHTTYHGELLRTLTTMPILPVAISMITTAFLQEILFRKWIFTWLAPYSKTAVLVSTGLFCLFHMPTNLAYLTLYIGMGLALSMIYQKRENLSASITLHVLWNLYTLGATILVMTNPM